MLDTCSQANFMKEELAKQLVVTGRETSVTIKTINVSITTKSTVVEGLKVSAAGDKRILIDLPNIYTREDLPVEADEVATPNKLRKWKYLQRIAPNICQEDNVNVALLIGANCQKALEPIEVVPSENGGPCAYKTLLGWCIVGPIHAEIQQTKLSKSNRIAVQNVSENKVAVHHFAVRNQAKENVIKQLMENIYKSEFTEPDLPSENKIGFKSEEISGEDKKFLQLMDSKVNKIGNHYQLPLPFRSVDPIMPNNRMVAQRRLQYLKKRFSKSPQFFQDYKTFMEDIIHNGYARKGIITAAPGKTWFIPHHGVYNENKPGKIRVVFDCGVEL